VKDLRTVDVVEESLSDITRPGFLPDYFSEQIDLTDGICGCELCRQRVRDL
jgi:hypothetical protein